MDNVKKALKDLLDLIDKGMEDSDSGLCFLDGSEPEILSARIALYDKQPNSLDS